MEYLSQMDAFESSVISEKVSSMVLLLCLFTLFVLQIIK